MVFVELDDIFDGLDIWCFKKRKESLQVVLELFACILWLVISESRSMIAIVHT